MKYLVSGDIFGGYESDLFEMLMPWQKVFNPSLYLELAAHSYAEVNLQNYAFFRMNIDIEAVRYNPVDLQVVWHTNPVTDMLLYGS